MYSITPVAPMEHDIPCGSGSEEVRFQGEPSPDLASLLQFKVYRRRWFILLVLCLLNCSNAMVCALPPDDVSTNVFHTLLTLVVVPVRIDWSDISVNNAFCKHLILSYFDLNLSKDGGEKA